MNRYLLRLVEQTAVAAVSGFLAAWAASGYDWSQAGLGAAAGAAVRAVYGMLAQPFGDKESPSVVK